MEIVVKLSQQNYRKLRSAIAHDSPAYEPVEKAAPIEHSVEGVLFAGYSISCDEAQAHDLLDIAKRDCPEAVLDIEKALRPLSKKN